MYTVLRKSEIPNHRKRADKPSLEVIDHRKKQKPVTIEESYDALRLQREALLDAEMRYQKRIRELESEATETAKAQEATQAENKNLKNIIDRGPKVSVLRKAKMQNDRLQQTITKLLEENRDLIQLINRMEKRDGDEWKDVFAETRRRQEERYSVLGPFVAGLNGKKSTITLNDIPTNKKVDDYDRQLETLSKETKRLLHKFEQMKRAKLSIDYATVMGPRNSMKNINKHRAIGDLINLDLNKYAAHLENLTSKHGKLTSEVIMSLSKEGKKCAKAGQKHSLPSFDSKDEAGIKPSDGKDENKKLSLGGTRVKTVSAPPSDVSRTINNRNAKSDTEIDDNYEKHARVKMRKRKVKSASIMSTQRGSDISVDKSPRSMKPRPLELRSRKIQDSDKSVRFTNEIQNKESKMSRSWSGEKFDHNDAKLIKSQAIGSKTSSSSLHHKPTKQSEFDTNQENKSLSQKNGDRMKKNLSKSNSVPNSTIPTPKSNELILDSRSGADTDRQMREPLDLASKRSRTNRESQRSTGKYSHGPETIDKSHSALIRIKGPEIEIQERANRGGQERYETNTNINHNRRESKAGLLSAKQSSAFQRTFPKNPPITKDSIHLKKAPNSDVVLQYLKQNNKSSSMDFNELFLDHEEHVPVPVPVTFREDAKTMRTRNIRYVTEADQRTREVENRREMFYRNFLNEP